MLKPLLFIDVGNSFSSREFLSLQICNLTPFAKKNYRENFRIYSTSIASRPDYDLDIGLQLVSVFGSTRGFR